MTNRVPVLLTVLFVSMIALIATKVGAGKVTTLTNEDVAEYSQPCYNKETTTMTMYGDIKTWCDSRQRLLMCTSDVEPTYCE